MSDSMQLVMTPTVARMARRSLFWIVIAFILLLLAVVGLALGASGQDDRPMSAGGATPAGAKALVEVLRHEGVTVIEVETLADARAAVDDRANTTLFFYDPNYYLSAAQTKQAMGLTDVVVALQPTTDALEYISPDLALAGHLGATLDAQCEVDAAIAAESIWTNAASYRILDDNTELEGCFARDDTFALVQQQENGVTLTALGATESLSNGEILREGNAALGLNLLGSTDTLVWYIPSADDYITDVKTLDELSPNWVQPVTLTLILVAIAAMIWRGRRLGPLIVENLPVTVKASETMQGRARLYEKANARLHTLDSLRIGTIARLASQCGLPVLATVDEVVSTVAAIAGQDPQSVRRLLVDAHPQSDRDLVRLSDDLLTLEQTVARNLRPH